MDAAASESGNIEDGDVMDDSGYAKCFMFANTSLKNTWQEYT